VWSHPPRERGLKLDDFLPAPVSNLNTGGHWGRSHPPACPALVHEDGEGRQSRPPLQVLIEETAKHGIDLGPLRPSGPEHFAGRGGVRRSIGAAPPKCRWFSFSTQGRARHRFRPKDDSNFSTPSKEGWRRVDGCPFRSGRWRPFEPTCARDFPGRTRREGETGFLSPIPSGGIGWGTRWVRGRRRGGSDSIRLCTFRKRRSSRSGRRRFLATRRRAGGFFVFLAVLGKLSRRAGSVGTFDHSSLAKEGSIRPGNGASSCTPLNTRGGAGGFNGFEAYRHQDWRAGFGLTGRRADVSVCSRSEFDPEPGPRRDSRAPPVVKRERGEIVREVISASSVANDGETGFSRNQRLLLCDPAVRPAFGPAIPQKP